jgi:competence protein ComEC
MSLRLVTRLAPAIALWLTLAAPASAQKMRVHLIDVGQGAATLVEFPCAALLIDTGGEANTQFDSVDELEFYLENFFSLRPDLNRTLHSLIVTHPHIDHTRGIRLVFDRYRVLNVVTNGQELADLGGKPQMILHRRIARGEMTLNDPSDDIGFVAAEFKTIPKNKGLTNDVIDPVKCANVDPKITLLWGALDQQLPGWDPKDFENENNHSVVTRIDFGASSLLVTGDLEFKGIEGLVAHHRDSTLLNTDVYQVGHHGSHNATTDELLAKITPKIALIPMGPPNRRDEFTAWAHGHPRKITVDRVEKVVTQTRDPIIAKVATGPGDKDKPQSEAHFTSQTIDKAIYATGWDGSVVLEADTAGNWKRVKPGMGPGLVDINKGELADLIQLPIGAVRAQAIIDHRTANGPFGSVDDLRNVKGLGPATFVTIRQMVTVGP